MPDGPILLVEDDRDIREILAETLADHGFEVVTAGNGLEALTLIRSATERPSVILLDLMMPVMDGYAFLDERRRDGTLGAIPVAIVTAGHTVDLSRIGDDIPVLPKPIDLPRLLGALKDLRRKGANPA
jgi:CheY-like chemotaxis protein